MANAPRIRAATDHAGHDDKLAFPDPAMAPLGTDSEAAGTGAPAAAAPEPRAKLTSRDQDRVASHHPVGREFGGWMRVALILAALAVTLAPMLALVHW